jgi:integrase
VCTHDVRHPGPRQPTSSANRGAAYPAQRDLVRLSPTSREHAVPPVLRSPPAPRAGRCRLVQLSALPPVRLHDLRHGAASLAHCAGADLKTVQEQLGHTSIVLTADTYTSVLHELHVKTAEATARLVLAAD